MGSKVLSTSQLLHATDLHACSTARVRKRACMPARLHAGLRAQSHTPSAFDAAMLGFASPQRLFQMPAGISVCRTGGRTSDGACSCVATAAPTFGHSHALLPDFFRFSATAALFEPLFKSG